MTIVGARIWRFRSPLVRSVTTRPGVVLRDRETVILALRDERGAVGWGEAAPLDGFSRESLTDVIAAATDMIGLIRARPFECSHAGDYPELLRRIMVGLPSLEFAVGSALDTLADENALQAGEISTSALLHGESAGEILARAEHVVGRGFGSLKLKVGRRAVDEDIGLIRSLRSRMGPEVRLRLDANRAWGWSQATRFADRCLELGVEFVEEPLADPGQVEELVRETGLPVALDETLAESSRDSIDVPGFLTAVVLKPTILGHERVLELASAARDKGVYSVMSACYESSIGTAAVARLAMSSTAHPAPAGLGTLAWLEKDSVAPRLDAQKPLLSAVVIQKTCAASRLEPEVVEEIRI